MRNLLKGIIICVVALMILNMVSLSYAQDMKKKLCRGFINIATGWMEIPNNVRDVTKEENLLSGLTLGIAKGCAMTIVRTFFGALEVTTFPFPIPEGYGPILEPEYVFKKN